MERSTISLLGLVRHMAKVERVWSRQVQPAILYRVDRDRAAGPGQALSHG
jgi:hypothetical protein